MPQPFVPRLEILPPPQRLLWRELSAVPAEFTLYGGTAIALHLGHRQSVDFDFFGAQEFNPTDLEARLPFLRDATITQRSPSTLTGIVDRRGPVKLSFFGVPAIHPVSVPHVAPDNGVKIAALLDLAGTEVSVIQQRAEARDYLDIDAMLTDGAVDLPHALAAGQAIYGRQFVPQLALKALSYFGEPSLQGLSADLKKRLASAARDVDLDRLPAIQQAPRGSA